MSLDYSTVVFIGICLDPKEIVHKGELRPEFHRFVDFPREVVCIGDFMEHAYAWGLDIHQEASCSDDGKIYFGKLIKSMDQEPQSLELSFKDLDDYNRQASIALESVGWHSHPVFSKKALRLFVNIEVY